MFYIIRHGQTVWNLQGRRQGQQDSPLTWKGVRQAQALGKALKLLELSSFNVYCSPLFRAKQFAMLTINDRYSWIIFDDRLKECNYARWEGLTDCEIQNQFPEEKEKRNHNRWNHKGHGGESYAELYDRIVDFLTEHQDENAIVFCHEVVSKIIRGRYLDWTQDQILKSNHPQNTYYCLQHNQCLAFKFCK